MAEKEPQTSRTLSITNNPLGGTKSIGYGIKTNGVVYQDDRTSKQSYWLYKVLTYTGKENIPQPSANEVCVVRPQQRAVWFNIVGETLQRTLELNLNNTPNTGYKVYYFTSNTNTQKYGYSVTHSDNSILYFSGTFGLGLTAVHSGNSNCSLGLGNMGYVYNHIGTYPVRITTQNKKVTGIRTKSYHNRDCGIVGGYNRGICMSNLRNGYQFCENYRSSTTYGHGYNKHWNNYFLLIADIPTGSF